MFLLTSDTAIIVVIDIADSLNMHVYATLWSGKLWIWNTKLHILKKGAEHTYN